MNWIHVLKTVAPTIAKSVGGPLEPVAITAIATGLGLHKQANEKDIEMVMANPDPEVLAKLKEAETNYKQHLKKLGVSTKPIKAINSGHAINWTASFLAIIITFAFLGLIYLLCMGKVPNSGLLNVLTGSLGTVWISIMTYYFGSSLSSAQKNDLLLKQND